MTADEADEFWRIVEAERRLLAREGGAWHRLRATVSLRSFVRHLAPSARASGAHRRKGEAPHCSAGAHIAMTNLELWNTVAIATTSLLAALLIYVWTAIALGAVFRKSGEPAWKGWVPILNIVVLLRLGGLSGWLVLLFIIPIAGWIALLIAVHRINVSFGYGGGMTVLAFFLFPVWASIVGFGPERWVGREVPGAPRARPVDDDGRRRELGLRAVVRSDRVRSDRPAPRVRACRRAAAGTARGSARRLDAAAAAAAAGRTAPGPAVSAPAPIDRRRPRSAPVDSGAERARTHPPRRRPSAAARRPLRDPDRRDRLLPRRLLRRHPTRRALPFAAPAASVARATRHRRPHRAHECDSAACRRRSSRSPTSTPPRPSSAASRTPLEPLDDDASDADEEWSFDVGTGLGHERGDRRGHRSARSRLGRAGALHALPTRLDSPTRTGALPPVTRVPAASDPASPVSRGLRRTRPCPARARRSPRPRAPSRRSPGLRMPVARALRWPRCPRCTRGRTSPRTTTTSTRRSSRAASGRRGCWWGRRARAIPLTSETVILGRRPARDPEFPDAQLISLDDDTRTISKTHARLELRDERWFITDLDSTNGVLFATAHGHRGRGDAGRGHRGGRQVPARRRGGVARPERRMTGARDGDPDDLPDDTIRVPRGEVVPDDQTVRVASGGTPASAGIRRVEQPSSTAPGDATPSRRARPTSSTTTRPSLGDARRRHTALEAETGCRTARPAPRRHAATLTPSGRDEPDDGSTMVARRESRRRAAREDLHRSRPHPSPRTVPPTSPRRSGASHRRRARRPRSTSRGRPSR